MFAIMACYGNGYRVVSKALTYASLVSSIGESARERIYVAACLALINVLLSQADEDSYVAIKNSLVGAGIHRVVRDVIERVSRSGMDGALRTRVDAFVVEMTRMLVETIKTTPSAGVFRSILQILLDAIVERRDAEGGAEMLRACLRHLEKATHARRDEGKDKDKDAHLATIGRLHETIKNYFEALNKGRSSSEETLAERKM